MVGGWAARRIVLHRKGSAVGFPPAIPLTKTKTAKAAGNLFGRLKNPIGGIWPTWANRLRRPCFLKFLGLSLNFLEFSWIFLKFLGFSWNFLEKEEGGSCTFEPPSESLQKPVRILKNASTLSRPCGSLGRGGALKRALLETLASEKVFLETLVSEKVFLETLASEKAFLETLVSETS